ncbi:glutathione synthetase ATP-binding domain-like superfamily protein [Paenibacillus chitinolyticus]|uniref:hypothetical protein n=1 Tax=Paenibacillus chitinolyticus TaxID=79263 RepID=UPI0026E4AE56|nr:hypothetical protein [Paenibacillus chitinolyticus]GKS12853.1 glutathione synthetase ATP-binding domain-like superfamily protein [Paenibacillus chitinolyticus]
MKNTLVITHSADRTVDYLIARHRDRVNWHRLNVDKLPEYQISVTAAGIRVEHDDFVLSNEEIFSVMYRKIVFPNLSEYHPSFLPLCQKDILSFVEGLAESLGQVCLARPSILKRAENKLVQLQEARAEGFIVPQTLLTNSSTQATAFIHNQKAVIKPLSSGVVKDKHVNGIIQTNVATRPIEDIGCEPSYLQEYKEKDGGEYRVTFMGDWHVAVKITSSNPVDWRKKTARNHYEVADLPPSLIDKCQRFMKRLGIPFGAFDFIRSGDKFYFLEVNPNGQWLWLEEELNLSISEQIVQFLQKGDTSYADRAGTS